MMMKLMMMALLVGSLKVIFLQIWGLEVRLSNGHQLKHAHRKNQQLRGGMSFVRSPSIVLFTVLCLKILFPSWDLSLQETGGDASMTGGDTPDLGMMSLGFSMLKIYKLNTDNAFEHASSQDIILATKPATEGRWLHEPGALSWQPAGDLFRISSHTITTKLWIKGFLASFFFQSSKCQLPSSSHPSTLPPLKEMAAMALPHEIPELAASRRHVDLFVVSLNAFDDWCKSFFVLIKYQIV